MIKRFHALYVGQTELDNIGLRGTPPNDRRYSNERLSEVFWAARDVARLLDELGYPRAFPRPAARACDHAARLREAFTADMLARKQALPAGW